MKSTAESGLGVFEMNRSETYAEQRELQPILQWLDGQATHQHSDNVVRLDENRKYVRNAPGDMADAKSASAHRYA